MKKSGVCKIKRKDCVTVYVGLYCQHMGTLFEEYCRTIMNIERNSGIFTHCNGDNNFVDIYDGKLLPCQRKWERLGFLEHLYIRKCIKDTYHPILKSAIIDILNVLSITFFQTKPLHF